jgi:DNA (cytosine-5)-methyltransferase 1
MGRSDRQEAAKIQRGASKSELIKALCFKTRAAKRGDSHKRQEVKLNELALFAGAGGGILGGKLLGWRTVCAVERDAYAAAVLAQRQNDGLLKPFPIWSDVTTFDGLPWRGRIDVVSGGFPCQDISSQGCGDGLDGERSGLWTEMGRIIRQVRPYIVFVENSPMLTSRGLGTVLGDLAEMGFNAEWGVLGAHHVGGPHERLRIWIVAHSDGNRLEGGNRINTERYRQTTIRPIPRLVQIATWPDVSDPRTFGSGDDVACRMERLKAIGNGQVPAVAAAAFNLLAA